MTLRDLRPGDRITRLMPGFRNDGVVDSVTRASIVAFVDIGVPRRMVFDRITGINTNGREHGWIVAGDAMPAQEAKR